VSRHLGPTGFGSLQYALSLVVIVASLGGLGLPQLLRRELLANPEQAPLLLGTTIRLQLLLGLLLYAGLAFAVVEAGSREMSLTLLIGLNLLFQPWLNLQIWFESQVEAHWSVRAAVAAAVLSGTFKLVAVGLGASLSTFAFLIASETILLAIFLFLFYLRVGKRASTWRFNWATGGRLIAKSWPLMLSGLAILIYMRIDQIMLRHFASAAAVGEYAIAVKFSTLAYAVPQFLAISLFPALMKPEGPRARASWRPFFALNALLAYLIIIPGLLLGPPLITFLFGAPFAASGAILQIHLLTCLPVFLGIARGQYLIAGEFYRLSLYFTAGGALLNVILNFIWIPLYGGVGAAWATVTAQLFSALLTSWGHPALRWIGREQFRALLVLPAILDISRWLREEGNKE